MQLVVRQSMINHHGAAIMLAESSYHEFTLEPGEAVSLRQTAGWEIVCLHGRVWLTEELGGADVWLGAGERLLLSRPGRTVIESEKGARLRICVPVAQWRRVFASTALRLRARLSRGSCHPAAPGCF